MNFLTKFVLIFFLNQLLSMQIAKMASSPLRSAMMEAYIATTHYKEPSSQDEVKGRNLFESLLTKKTFTQEDINSWSELGLTLRQLTDENDKNYAVINELPPNQGVGHGFYAIKLADHGNTSENILEAPHRPSDSITHEIVLNWLISSSASAVGISSTHRNNVDLAKANFSYFNAFTEASGRVFTHPRVIQLHGFNKESHNTDADVIYSSSKTQLPSKFLPMTNCLKNGLISSSGFVIKNYPDEIDFLGGTLNINAHRLYQTNGNNGMFFHVETSLPLRNAMKDNENLSREFINCFSVN